MTPQDYVQQKASASGSSFYYAFLFLPPQRRAAITAFYAFCREVDDVVDEIADPSVAASKLQWWRKEVAQAFAGEPSHPVMRALMPLAPEFWTYSFEVDGVPVVDPNNVHVRRNGLHYTNTFIVPGEPSCRLFDNSGIGCTDFGQQLCRA